MAGRSAILSVKILTDATKAKAGIGETGSAMDKFKGTMGDLAVPAAAVATSLLALGKIAADSASQQQQAMGALDSVYGKSAGIVKAYAQNSATAVGLSKTAYANAASSMGASLVALGFDQAKAAESSNSMISLGADLAATFGGTAADAVSALGATLRGEYDSAEKYGLGLSAATVNAELAARGQDKLEGSALASAKAQATLDIATKNAAGSMGQFARESGTAAGSQEIANAKFEDAKAALGEKLLPVITTVTEKLSGLADWISKNTVVAGIIAGVLGTLAAVILILNAAIVAWDVVMKIVNATFWSSPIFWIVAGIVALIAVIVIIATKTTWFQDIWNAAFKAISDIVQTVWGWISKNWPLLLAILTGPIGLAVKFIVDHIDDITGAAKAVWNYLSGAFSTVWDTVKTTAKTALDAILAPINAIKAAFDAVIGAVKSVIDWISKIKIPDIGSIASKLNPFAKSAPAPAGYTTAPTYQTVVGARSAPAGTRATPAAGPTIIVQGAIDAVATARQIRLILRDDTRRRSGVTIGRSA